MVAIRFGETIDKHHYAILQEEVCLIVPGNLC
jgi:hypothetical protein